MTTSGSAGETPLVDAVRSQLRSSLSQTTPKDLFFALGRALRGPLLAGMRSTEERNRAAGAKRLHYLSAEFLVGRSMRDNLQNLGLLAEATAAMAELGADLADVLEAEHGARKDRRG